MAAPDKNVADVFAQDPTHVSALDEETLQSRGRSIPDALGGNFLNRPFESVATAMSVSAFSLKSLTFNATVAWPQRAPLGWDTSDADTVAFLPRLGVTSGLRLGG